MEYSLQHHKQYMTDGKTISISVMYGNVICLIFFLLKLCMYIYFNKKVYCDDIMQYCDVNKRNVHLLYCAKYVCVKMFVLDEMRRNVGRNVF